MKHAVLIFAVTALFAGVLRTSSSASSARENIAFPDPTPTSVASDRPLDLTDAEFDGKQVVKSDEEWKKELTPTEYYIMRQEGTEQPYTGSLTNNHQKGKYYCAACGLVLFRSSTTFESGTGWPSFYAPIYKKNVIEHEDRSLAS